MPESWRLIAYLCLGRPVEEHLDPELGEAALILRRSCFISMARATRVRS